MISIWSVFIAAVVLALVIVLVGVVIVPLVKLNAVRRESRNHIPQAEEIWVQDDGIIYIESVNASGVEVLAIDSITRRPDRWKDSWPEWHERLKVRTVYFTGQRRSLTDPSLNGPSAV